MQHSTTDLFRLVFFFAAGFAGEREKARDEVAGI